MNRVMITLWVLIVLINITMVGCGKSKGQTIVGKWKEVDGTEIIEFFKDGTVKVTDEGLAISGDYRFIDDNRIRLNLGGIGGLLGAVIAELFLG